MQAACVELAGAGMRDAWTDSPTEELPEEVKVLESRLGKSSSAVCTSGHAESSSAASST